MILSSLILGNTSSIVTRSVRLIFSIFLKHHISKLSFAVRFSTIVIFTWIKFRRVVIPKFVFLPDMVLVIKRDTGEKGIVYRILFENPEAEKPL